MELVARTQWVYFFGSSLENFYREKIVSSGYLLEDKILPLDITILLFVAWCTDYLTTLYQWLWLFSGEYWGLSKG
jgi:hypothetical protein